MDLEQGNEGGRGQIRPSWKDQLDAATTHSAYEFHGIKLPSDMSHLQCACLGLWEGARVGTRAPPHHVDTSMLINKYGVPPDLIITKVAFTGWLMGSNLSFFVSLPTGNGVLNRYG